MEFLKQRPGPRLAHLATMAGGFTTYVCLDRIELRDARDSFGGDRGVMRHVKVIELAPYVRPTCGFLNPAAFVEVMKARVSICLQHAGEAIKMLARTLALAIRGVGEPHGWSRSF
jgi:hypothetical protein